MPNIGYGTNKKHRHLLPSGEGLRGVGHLLCIVQEVFPTSCLPRRLLQVSGPQCQGAGTPADAQPVINLLSANLLPPKPSRADGLCCVLQEVCG